MPSRLLSLTIAAALVVSTLTPLPAAAFDTEARYAYIYDKATGAVLLDKNGDQRMPPASMSKLMTIYIVFGLLKQGKLKMDDELPVSENAWRKQGSKMFVAVNTRVRVEDLLRGAIIQSGNDACLVLAEGIAGSEEAFTRLMNDKAKELGLNGSHFSDATGWPDPGQYMTPKDLTVLAIHIMDEFPEYFHFFSEREFTYHNIKQGNRNPLLYHNVGVDGMKTGHTEEAGFGLIATALRDNRRIIMVVNGLMNMKTRYTEAERLLDWAYREWNDYTLFKAGETVENAPVWMGDKDTVPLVAKTDAVVTMQRTQRKDMKVTVDYQGPIKAPIAKGQQIAKLVVTSGQQTVGDIPLYAGADVEALGPIGRAGSAVAYLVWGRGRS